MTENENSNGLQTIISQALETLNAKYGKIFNLDKVNLAELQRMTGISRSRFRHLQKNHFVVQPHGRIGLHARVTFVVVLKEYLIRSYAKALRILRYVLKNSAKSDIPAV